MSTNPLTLPRINSRTDQTGQRPTWYGCSMSESTTLVAADERDDTDEELLDDELLVEEISIDGMCGVY